MVIISGITFTSHYYIVIISKHRKMQFTSTDFIVHLSLKDDSTEKCSLSDWISAHTVHRVKKSVWRGSWFWGWNVTLILPLPWIDEKMTQSFSMWMVAVGVVPPPSVIRLLHSFPLSCIRWPQQVMCCEMCGQQTVHARRFAEEARERERTTCVDVEGECRWFCRLKWIFSPHFCNNEHS